MRSPTSSTCVSLRSSSLDRAVSNAHPDLSAAIKWRQLTYAPAGVFHHRPCAIAVTKKAVGLRFHSGGLLDDPHAVFHTGSSRFPRAIDFISVDDVDPRPVADYTRHAVSRLDGFRAAGRDRGLTETGVGI